MSTRQLYIQIAVNALVESATLGVFTDAELVDVAQGVRYGLDEDLARIGEPPSRVEEIHAAIKAVQP